MTADAKGVLRFRRVRGSQAVETRRCDVHGEDLVQEEVPILYGLPRFPCGYEEALMEEFPHAGTLVLGGCCVDGRQPTATRYWLCRSCREAEKAWHRKHPKGGLRRQTPEGPRPQGGFWFWLRCLLRHR